MAHQADDKHQGCCPKHPEQTLVVVQDKEFTIYFGLVKPVLCCPVLFCDYIQIDSCYFARLPGMIQLLMFARQKADFMKRNQCQRDDGK